jgi:hypothetical protein
LCNPQREWWLRRKVEAGEFLLLNCHLAERRRAWQEYLIYGNGSIITSLCLRIWRSRRMTCTLSIVSWVCTLHQCWAVTQFGQSNTGLHFLHLSSYIFILGIPSFLLWDMENLLRGA